MIRAATPQDAEAVYGLWRSLSKHEASTMTAPYPLMLDEDAARTAWLPEYLAGLEQQGTLFLLDETDGAIRGYVVGYVNRRSFGNPKLFFEVAEMYVDPAYRKGFVGFRLLRAIERITAKAGIEVMEMAALTTKPQTDQALRAGWTPYIQKFYKKVRIS